MQQVYWFHIEANTYLQLMRWFTFLHWSLAQGSYYTVFICSHNLEMFALKSQSVNVSTDEKAPALDWIFLGRSNVFLQNSSTQPKEMLGTLCRRFDQTDGEGVWTLFKFLLSSKTGVSISLEAIIKLFVRTWPRSRVVMAARWKRPIGTPFCT